MSGRPDEERAPVVFSEQLATRIFWSLLATYLLLVVWTFRDYGITWDEDIQSRYGQTLLRWYATLSGDDSATHFGNLYLYGGFFETLAELASRLSPLGHFETRHLLGALCGAFSFLAVFGAGRELSGATAGLFAAILLIINPLFYGHLFANSKDSPFAIAFMVALYFMLASLRVLAQGRDLPVLRLGLSIGICAGIRAWGIGLLGFLALLWGPLSLLRLYEPKAPDRLALFRRCARAFLQVSLIAWLTMIAAWPWATLHPVTGPIRALFATATLRPDVASLFRGEIISAGSLPWDYAFTWLAVTLPEAHLLALVLGFLLAGAWLFARLRKSSASVVLVESLPLAWLTLAAVSPLVLVALARPFLYDGIRHLLFVIPPLCVLSGVALAEGLRSPLPPFVKGLVGFAVMASCMLTVADMVELHPYQTVYFNRVVAGGLSAAAERYDTDYWGSTYKEGVEWLAKNYEPASPGPIRLALVGAGLQLTYYLEPMENGKRFEVRDRDVDPQVLLITRSRNRYKRIKGRLLHTIDRKGTPLLFIFEIRSGDAAKAAGPSG